MTHPHTSTPNLLIMQTFLTYPDSFTAIAKSLDYKRLGKQRVETKQILLTNRKLDSYQQQYTYLSVPLNVGWRNHPAARMWRGHDGMLALYGAKMCKEWINRGYQDSLLPFFEEIVFKSVLTWPAWMTDPKMMDRIVDSHRRALIHKYPEHYQPLFPSLTPKLDYYWPV